MIDNNIILIAFAVVIIAVIYGIIKQRGSIVE